MSGPISHALLSCQILLATLGFAAGGYLFNKTVNRIAESGNNPATTLGLIISGCAMISGLLLGSLSAVLMISP